MQNLARIIGIGTVAAAAFALTACGSDDSDSAVGATSTTSVRATTQAPAATPAPAAQSHGRECTAADIAVAGGFGENPTITLPDDCDAPTRLIVEDLVPGSGPGAQPGQELTMNYSLVAWSNGEKLDSSFDRGEPFGLILGAGQVIPGWEQGLEGVQEGARRLLIIPPELGYGARGSGGVEPNETLVFVTDAVGVGK
ncbi:FKBP-type peptidyl-prolyl cis-trans isomerase [Nocardia higoensis]|uniref:FKBP-type peptidyl-prolyl cis-trans isomerase n=1 Tax=Nocardia higoensis TaxID=228599 RepID=UPI000317A48E|nr:FKBP-type peptidyl-prolyl cis-trans isomerase [Nocardia higoensis]